MITPQVFDFELDGTKKKKSDSAVISRIFNFHHNGWAEKAEATWEESGRKGIFFCGALRGAYCGAQPCNV